MSVTPPTNTDPRMRELLANLNPSLDQQTRMEARVLREFEADQQSLASEWLELLRVGPMWNTGGMFAAATALVVITPIGLTLFLTVLSML
ncbi:MAG: hypothetical protein ABI333_10250 [bacterium]